MTTNSRIVTFVISFLAVAGLFPAIVLITAIFVAMSPSNDQYENKILKMQLDEIDAGKSNELKLYDTRRTDELLRTVTNPEKIQSLQLEKTDVAETGMRVIARWPSLKRVTIQGAPQVTDAALGELAQSETLQTLDLIYTRVTDIGLRTLARTKTLEVLALESNGDHSLTD